MGEILDTVMVAPGQNMPVGAWCSALLGWSGPVTRPDESVAREAFRRLNLDVNVPADPFSLVSDSRRMLLELRSATGLPAWKVYDVAIHELGATEAVVSLAHLQPDSTSDMGAKQDLLSDHGWFGIPVWGWALLAGAVGLAALVYWKRGK